MSSIVTFRFLYLEEVFGGDFVFRGIFDLQQMFRAGESLSTDPFLYSTLGRANGRAELAGGDTILFEPVT